MDSSYCFTALREIRALPTAACSNIFINLTLLLTAEQIVSICWEWDRWQQKKHTWILWHKHWKSSTDLPPCKKVKKLVNILIKFNSILSMECLTSHTHIFRSLSCKEKKTLWYFVVAVAFANYSSRMWNKICQAVRMHILKVCSNWFRYGILFFYPEFQNYLYWKKNFFPLGSR